MFQSSGRCIDVTLSRSLAVIVPVLNEAEHLGAVLGDLARQTADFETVVVDGGSSDDTIDVARRCGVKVITAPRGRGRQMNAGRAAVDAEWLLFLHADSRLTDDTLLDHALRALEPSQCGHFRLRFRSADPRFRYLEAKTILSRPHTTNGDQGLLVPAELFDAVGGFDTTLEFLEDQRFVAAVRQAGGEWITLPGTLTTSARRFDQHGFGAQYFTMSVLMAAWGGGADELFDRYPDIYNAELPEVIAAVRAATRDMGGRRAIEVYMAAARFVRAEAWQLFFALDLLRDDGEEPHTRLLDWYDRTLAEVDLRIVDGLIAAVGYLLLNVVLTPDSTASTGR